jgi:hypothetical protein
MAQLLSWVGENTMSAKLLAFTATVDQIFQQQVEEFAQEVEDYAKENAPWEDRTSDAREGLTATATTTVFHYVIDLYHTVEYGIWLEVRWTGRFAIILPTIEVKGPELMARLDWGV